MKEKIPPNSPGSSVGNAVALILIPAQPGGGSWCWEWSQCSPSILQTRTEKCLYSVWLLLLCGEAFNKSCDLWDVCGRCCFLLCHLSGREKPGLIILGTRFFQLRMSAVRLSREVISLRFFFWNRQRSCFILCWVDKGVLSVLLKSVSHGKALGVCPLKLQCFVFSVCDSTWLLNIQTYSLSFFAAFMWFFYSSSPFLSSWMEWGFFSPSLWLGI